MQKRYFKDLDIVRFFSCVMVFLYHLGLIKGGFLAVCFFFVLSGYLAVSSNFKKESFSFLSYYKDRFFHIYIPLFVVVMLSILTLRFFPSIHLISLKADAVSVLLGYNNYWQLGANLDYFARHLNSPFMHFWYLAILLQFELIFPFLFLLLKRLGEKIHKVVPIFISFSFALFSIVYFFYLSYTKQIMAAYYDTFARSFSLFLGVGIGFLHAYYKKSFIPNFFLEEKRRQMIFWYYLLFFAILCFFVSSSSSYFSIFMVLSSLVSCRLIEYGIVHYQFKIKNFWERGILTLAQISYLVYLVQYPVIFFFQYCKIPHFLQVIFPFFITFFLSFLLHFTLNLKGLRNRFSRFFAFRSLLFSILVVLVSIGFVSFLLLPDHTKEMKDLQFLLEENEKDMKNRQEEYAKKMKEEQDQWESVMNELENQESSLAEVVHNLGVVGVGDSIMLGALPSLYQVFPNGYFDAKVSRTDYEAGGILWSLNSQGIFGNPVVFNLGANGQCGASCREEIVSICGDRKIFWINVTNDNEVHVNSGFNEFAEKYPNFYVIDWNSISSGHSDWFVADGIHLTSVGAEAYAEAIYQAIYNVYLEEYQSRKEELLNKHWEEEKNKISFYGNDLLFQTSSILQKEYEDANFFLDSEYTYEKLFSNLKTSKENGVLPNKIVLAFDASFALKEPEYSKILDLLEGHEVYWVAFRDFSYSGDNLSILDFSKEIKKHPEYLMIDQVHLSNEGCEALSKMILDALKEN